MSSPVQFLLHFIDIEDIDQCFLSQPTDFCQNFTNPRCYTHERGNHGSHSIERRSHFKLCTEYARNFTDNICYW